MKLPFLLCVLFIVVAIQPTAPAQDLGSNTIDSLHNSITKGPYAYIKGNFTLTINFKPDGTGDCTDWKFKWHSKDAQTIEMEQLNAKNKLTGKKTTLTFSADYKTFTGTDFDEITKVTGHLPTAGQ
jgi:hypothetical protein